MCVYIYLMYIYIYMIYIYTCVCVVLGQRFLKGQSVCCDLQVSLGVVDLLMHMISA